MTARPTLAAINAFLEAVYGPRTRLSTLLSEAGYTAEQVAVLRHEHLDRLVDAFVAALALRVRDAADEGACAVLARQFGLDGQPGDKDASLGQGMDRSAQPVSQIEAAVLERCRSIESRRHWRGVLTQTASELLATHVSVPPPPFVADPVRDQAGADVQAAPEVAAAAGQVSATAPVLGIEAPVLEHLHTMIAAVDAAIGAWVSPHLIANILFGSTGPIVRALVAYYHLEFASGSGAGMDRRVLTEVVKQVRAEGAGERAAKQAGDRLQQVAPADCATVRRMMGDIEAALGYRLWGVMLGYVLTGSTGAKVVSLVKEHNLPHYGALANWGTVAVKAAIHAVRSVPAAGEDELLTPEEAI